ncbi:MAG: hypothetical protein JWO58_2540 [Chitinophagaceae bacterium]|nr:hypothetical protein [Chitinophagaceae bacterium]
MLLPGTQIHIAVFTILLFELVIFFFQVIYFLSRPSDKNRLWFLILLSLLIYYNVVSGFLPDPNIPLPITVQNIFAYSGGLFMSMYFPFYFYKAFSLTKLRFYAFWGSIVFLLIPFLILFLVPYYLTGDLDLCRKIVVVVPFFYALSFLYSLTQAIQAKNKESKDHIYKREILGMYIGVIFWVSLPIIVFFNGSQLLENSFANAGLVVMTILFIHQAIQDAKQEYNVLLNSERKLLELNESLKLKVKERTKELEFANEQKTNTFINLAHETKTPLTLINNYLNDYIEKYGGNKEINIVKSNVERLTKDIVNFFDSERLKKGIVIYNHGQVADFSSLLNQSIELFKPYSQKMGMTLQSEIEDRIYINADPVALNRIINNLIENAIRYGKERGQINVSLHNDNNNIIFSVKDDGHGIRSKFHKKIFEGYYQINSEKKNSQGLGMGLSIVKQITDSLNGKITLISDPPNKEGTEFIIQLNRYYNNPSDIITPFSSDKKEALDLEVLQDEIDIQDNEQPTIMLIEDNIALLNYMYSKLKPKYNILFATGGQEALAKIKTTKILDLIISDVMMDKGNGIEFYKIISSNKKYNHIPFIFLTAKGTIKDKVEGLSLGAIDYIAKPFLFNELSTKIESILKNHQKQREALIKSFRVYLNDKEEEEPKTISDPDTIFAENCQKFSLTVRETEIAKLMATGQTYKTIGDSLYISDKTVGKHVENILKKASVTNRSELVNKLFNK